jgi:hypothetical protein
VTASLLSFVERALEDRGISATVAFFVPGRVEILG